MVSMEDAVVDGRVSRGTAAPSGRTKRCPRCGAVLFEDMDVCYGCLYDFSKDRSGSRRADTSPHADSGEFDCRRGGDGCRRHEEDISDGDPAEATSVLGRTVADVVAQGESRGSRRACVGIRMEIPGADVTCPLPPMGISVGRDSGNDICLHDRTVSRHHVRLVRADGGVIVEDRGATNPALVNGSPLVGGEVFVPVGGTVEVCGAKLTFVRLPG